MSGRELTEWMAYEHEYGVLGAEWEREAQAVMIDMLQNINYVLIASNSDTQPTEPRPYPRATEFLEEDAD